MHTLEHSTIAQLSVHQTLSCSVTTLSITDYVVNFHVHTSASHALIYIYCFDTVCWATKTVIRPVKILAGASAFKPTAIKGKWFVRCHYHHLPKRQKVRCTYTIVWTWTLWNTSVLNNWWSWCHLNLTVSTVATAV